MSKSLQVKQSSFNATLRKDSLSFFLLLFSLSLILPVRSLAHAGDPTILQDLAAPEAANVQNSISLASGNGTHSDTGNGESRKPAISADGRFIAFSSRATDLVPGLTDNNDAPDVFLYDRLNNFTQLISSNGGNSTANGPSGMLNLSSTLDISADGRYVVYASDASDIVPLDNNGATDIFLFDRLNGANHLVSTKYFVTTQPANGSSFKPVISANGRLVVFSSAATDLSATPDTNGKTDLYAANLDNLVAKLVTANLAGNNGGNDDSSLSSAASVSDDGRFVAFDSQASDLVSNDTNGGTSFGTDVFVRDLQSDITTLVTVNAAGTGSGNLNSFGSNTKISGNGRFVVFESSAGDLVTGTTESNNGHDIFRRDLVAGTTSLVSINLAGNSSGNDVSQFPVVSNDGRFVAFSSQSGNLVAVDNNNGIGSLNDVFVRDMQSATTSLVSINSAGTDSGNSSSGFGPNVISSDGRYVLFQSNANNLTGVSDTNSAPDLFLRDLQTAATTLMSLNRLGGAGTVYFENVLSRDGQVAAFESRGNNLVNPDTNHTTDIFAAGPTSPQLSVSDVTVTEGDSGSTNAVFTVTLTDGPASGNVTASAVTFDGSALSIQDYQFVSSPLTFAPGETTKTVAVPVFGDTLFEGNETFTLELRDVTGAAIADGVGLGTIIDNEQQPTLSVNDITVTEGDSGTTDATFTVTLSGVSNNSVGFGFGLTNGTALEEEDFLGVGGGALIAAGMTSSTITVPIVGDTIKESNETFFLNLANASNATIADNQGVATIIDDESASEPATVQFSVWRPSVSEGAGSIVVEVTRSGDLSASSSVDYATSATLQASDRSDFTSAFGTLTFAAGEASKTITVLLTDDVLVEGNEQFLINLANATGATLGTPATSVVKITDNDTTAPNSNPIDGAPFFVRQHYLDFFSREADPNGLAFWSNQITECQQPGATCDAAVRRINVSAAFFLSIEFQETGYLVERLYKSAYGDATGTSNFGTTHQLPVPVVRLNEFLPDTQKIGRGVVVGESGWEQRLAANKIAFVQDFVQRPRFSAAYPGTMTPAEFVDALYQHAGVTPTAAERASVISGFGGAPTSVDTTARAGALGSVAANSRFIQQETNKAFVLMQYFGYLRRNPNDTPDADYTGYDFWLTKLNEFNGNFVNAEMVKAFLVSGEYRQRFGP